MRMEPHKIAFVGDSSDDKQTADQAGMGGRWGLPGDMQPQMICGDQVQALSSGNPWNYQPITWQVGKTDMKGLDLAEQYFLAHGLPMLQRRFAQQIHRVAAGLVGPGSECYGFDDHLSRDHDWGPGFCLWVDKAGFGQFGNRLQTAYESLPDIFMNVGPRQCSPGESHRVGVIEIEQFYHAYTGLDHPPQNTQEWLGIPEEALSICTNGRVFQDPDGRFSSWRQHLQHYYPEEVRIYKLAAACVKAAQSGQYNLKRSLERGEWFAFRYAEIQFCDQALVLTFLLNRRYAPFYKWRHRSVKALSDRGRTIYRAIARLMDTRDRDQKIPIVGEICAVLIKEIQRQQLTDSSSDFLLDHVSSISNRLNDAHLRGRFTMVS
jgi:Domain of unknown function (DUF4037)